MSPPNPDWTDAPYRNWTADSGGCRYRMSERIMVASRQTILWEGYDVKLLAHMGRKTIVGYEVLWGDIPMKWYAQPYYIGLFRDLNTPNQSPETVYGDLNLRLLHFPPSNNLAIALRAR